MRIKSERKHWIVIAAIVLVAITVTQLPTAISTLGGHWYDDCPPDPPTRTPWPVQPTLTPRPTLTPAPIPTCRPTATLAPNSSPSPYPTATYYPTPTVYPPQPDGTPSPTPASSTPAAGRTLKYYGVDTAEPGDFALLARYYINTVFVALDAGGSETEWATYLDEAERCGLMVMVWPTGGSGDCGFPYDGADISAAHRLLDYLATKSFFVGILNAHEPFWSCPATVEEMAAIKTEIKNYLYQNHGREIEVINHIDNLDDFFFQHAEPADIGKIADWMGVWKHCFNGEGSCEYMVEQTIADRQAIRDAGLEEDVELALLFQTFGGGDYRMPSAGEMQEWACAVLETNALDGFFWYTWDNPSSYSEHLSQDRYDANQEDRWEVMRTVWESCVSQ